MITKIATAPITPTINFRGLIALGFVFKFTRAQKTLTGLIAIISEVCNRQFSIHPYAESVGFLLAIIKASGKDKNFPSTSKDPKNPPNGTKTRKAQNPKVAKTLVPFFPEPSIAKPSLLRYSNNTSLASP